jgi:hypothetical protein
VFALDTSQEYIHVHSNEHGHQRFNQDNSHEYYHPIYLYSNNIEHSDNIKQG